MTKIRKKDREALDHDGNVPVIDRPQNPLNKKQFEAALTTLQVELVKMQLKLPGI